MAGRRGGESYNVALKYRVLERRVPPGVHEMRGTIIAVLKGTVLKLVIKSFNCSGPE